MIPTPNIIYTPITENHHSSILVSNTDGNFQKLELKICKLNKSEDYELALLN